MALAIFDLGNTLIAGDSDFIWGKYLIENNYVDGDEKLLQIAKDKNWQSISLR